MRAAANINNSNDVVIGITPVSGAGPAQETVGPIRDRQTYGERLLPENATFRPPLSPVAAPDYRRAVAPWGYSWLPSHPGFLDAAPWPVGPLL